VLQSICLTSLVSLALLQTPDTVHCLYIQRSNVPKLTAALQQSPRTTTHPFTIPTFSHCVRKPILLTTSIPQPTHSIYWQVTPTETEHSWSRGQHQEYTAPDIGLSHWPIQRCRQLPTPPASIPRGRISPPPGPKNTVMQAIAIKNPTCKPSRSHEYLQRCSGLSFRKGEGPSGPQPGLRASAKYENFNERFH